MGLIVRTAGLQRTKTEIKRDFDYLARLWDEIRERTLGSTAPALIYRDSDLIKRAIRDLYHREIDEVIVEGEEGYKAARGFMKLLMPSHVRRVKLHSETTPLFQRYGVEDQLSAMYQPIVQLKSGGYLVINPTEALVSIDINSGRSTREHNIEQTAFNTNLEAAQEIARQLRLRDMAGLIVIDFIDMEQISHVRKVEKAMKEALKNDRARIQVGRISSFGLMEMSRQRLRTGVLEASTKPCPHCDGTGLMRTAASAGLSALRIIEDEAARGRGERICLRAGREAAVYVLNKKRAELADIEQRYGVCDRDPDRRELRRRAHDGRKLRARGPSRAPRAEAPPRRRGRRRGRDGRDLARGRGRRRAKRPRPRRSEEREAQPKATGRAVAGAAAAAADAAAAGAKAPKARPPPRATRSSLPPQPRNSRPSSPRPRPRSEAPASAAAGAAARKSAEAAAEQAAEPVDRARQLADGRAPGGRGAADRRDRARRSEAQAEAPPARRRRRPRPKSTVAEPAPAEAPPAETADRPPARPSPRASAAPRRRPSRSTAEPAAESRSACPPRTTTPRPKRGRAAPRLVAAHLRLERLRRQRHAFHPAFSRERW